MSYFANIYKINNIGENVSTYPSLIENNVILNFFKINFITLNITVLAVSMIYIIYIYFKARDLNDNAKKFLPDKVVNKELQILFLKTYDICLIISLILFFYTMFMFLAIDPKNYLYQVISNYFNIRILDFALDPLSLVFILLLYILFFLVLMVFRLTRKWEGVNINLISEKEKDLFNYKFFYENIDRSFLYLFWIFFLTLDIFILFTTLDLIVFYITFEMSMIPLFFLIVVFGKREERKRAAYYLFFYTFVSSIPFLVAILYLNVHYGTTNYILLNYCIIIPENEQLWLWAAFFIPFATKLPIMPLHIWLPEAHVEASTEGSVLLAGLLLKLGVYGVIRFLLTLFPYASHYFSSIVNTLAIISIIYSLMSAFRQVDLKKIIAYFSIAHMNVVVLGLFSFSVMGVGGALFLMFGHGIVSSGLFLCIGLLYARFRSRYIHYYAGLQESMPLFSGAFYVLIFGNSSFPLTVSFVGEFLIILGEASRNLVALFFLLFGIFLSSILSIVVLVRICMGVPYKYTHSEFVLKNIDCVIYKPSIEKKNYISKNFYKIIIFKDEHSKDFFSSENLNLIHVKPIIKKFDRKKGVLTLRLVIKNYDLNYLECQVLGIFCGLTLFLGLCPNGILAYLESYSMYIESIYR